MNIIYNKGINTFLRTVLKPFSARLPERFKFPVNGTFTVKGAHVPRFKMATNPTSWSSRKLFWDNVEGFEFSSVRIFTKLISNSRLFIDIGSNIGYYSLLASRISNGETRVYAFEPMPSAFEFLSLNIRLNKFNNITPVKAALSDQEGDSVFYSIVNPKFENLPQLTGDGGLSQVHSGTRARSSFNVKVMTLDHFVSSINEDFAIDFMKIDTEANEHMVLRGAKKVLADHRPIIQCEILKGQVEREVEEALAPFNYRYFIAAERGLMPVDHLTGNKTSFVDFYLVPAEKLPLVASFIV
jgi:FkbM family methyltransferase